MCLNTWGFQCVVLFVKARDVYLIYSFLGSFETQFSGKLLLNDGGGAIDEVSGTFSNNDQYRPPTCKHNYNLMFFHALISTPYFCEHVSDMLYSFW